MLRNSFKLAGLKFVFPLVFLLGCGGTEVTESAALVTVSLTPASSGVINQTSIINGYPFDVVVSRNGSVLSSVDTGTVSAYLVDPTSGCAGSGCLRLQAAAGSNAVSVKSFQYINGKATVYVGAHASVAAQNISISAVFFTLGASVATSGVQASAAVRVQIL